MKFEAIDDFIMRVKSATRSGSKDLRLSAQEAQLLALSLTELLSKLQQGTPPVSAPPSILDGGSFTER